MIVSFWLLDANSARADHLIGSTEAKLFVSDWARAEFAAVVARRVRGRQLEIAGAMETFADFDRWAFTCDRVGLEAGDSQRAERFLRNVSAPLRAPDALHLAIAARAGCELATFDPQLRGAAAAWGVELAIV